MYWYAVNTKPRQEELAECSLHRLNVETFYPRLERARTQEKEESSVGPLFPGYVFARFDLQTHYRAVRYAPSVRTIVAFGPIPAIVEDEFIEALRVRLCDGYLRLAPRPQFARGQLVKVLDGPLQGLEAIFEEELNNHQRAILLLRHIAYQARVVVDLDQVVNL